MRLKFLIPLAAFALIAAAFGAALFTFSDRLPSALIDRPVPEFTLPAIEGRELGLSSADLKGGVALVNVFASWCASCTVEQPVLMRIKKKGGVPVFGLNWKDRPGDGARWLARYGDPYARIGDDALGRVAVDFGVTGAPETFVIDSRGRVRHKHVGPITEDDWRRVLLPIVEELQHETPPLRDPGDCGDAGDCG